MRGEHLYNVYNPGHGPSWAELPEHLRERWQGVADYAASTLAAEPPGEPTGITPGDIMKWYSEALILAVRATSTEARLALVALMAELRASRGMLFPPPAGGVNL